MGFRVFSADSGWRVLLVATCAALGVASDDVPVADGDGLSVEPAPTAAANGEDMVSIGLGLSMDGDTVVD